MKRTVFIFIMCLLFAVCVSGAEYEFGTGEGYELYPAEEMDALYNSLPDDVKAELEDFSSAKDTPTRLSAIGEKLDLRYLIKVIFSYLGELILPVSGGCAALLGIILTVTVVKNTLSDDASVEICEFVTSLAMAISVGGILSEGIAVSREFIERISGVMNAMIPVMNTVMLSQGSVTAMSVNSSALMLYITVMENMTSLVLVPLGGALFALSTAAVLLRGINISTFISSLKKITVTILSFSLMIFSFVLGIQTSLAKSADTLTMKTVRFAVGSYIPIVGGVVSEALSTVTAGLSHVRNITGTVGVIIVLLTVLPVVLSLILSRLSFAVCRSMAEALGCGVASEIITDADSVLSLFLALCAMTAVFFIFAIVLFMNSGIGV